MLTVVTPATSRRLTTVEHVREDLGLTEAAASTAKIERLIDQASSAIETYCRRGFARQRYRETYSRFYGRPSVILDRWPVSSIVSVTVDGAVLATSDFEVQDGFLYRLGANGRGYWTAGTFAVEYEAGYILPGETGADLPSVVEQACIGEISGALSRRARDPLMRSENVDGVGSTAWQIQSGDGPLIHPDSAGLLAEFRLTNL